MLPEAAATFSLKTYFCFLPTNTSNTEKNCRGMSFKKLVNQAETVKTNAVSQQL